MIKLALIVMAGGFSLLYLSALIPGRAVAVHKFLGFVRAHLKTCACAGLGLGVIGIFAAPLATRHDSELLLELLDSLALITMATPHVFLSLRKDLDGKVNAAILQECDGFFAQTAGKSAVFGFAGAGLTLLLAATLFGAFLFEIL
jgi:hypothetical protein